MPRDPELTRKKVLAAAVAEFAAHGYAGARIDRIAGRAGVNKRMLYHHFGAKEAVFEAALADRLSAAEVTDELVRLWMHESLERGDQDIVLLEERAQLVEDRIAATRASQPRGGPPDRHDPRLVALANLALEVFPVAFPQLVLVVAGQRAASEEFDASWQNLLRDWNRRSARDTAKPRLRLDRGRVSRAARHATGAMLATTPAESDA